MKIMKTSPLSPPLKNFKYFWVVRGGDITFGIATISPLSPQKYVKDEPPVYFNIFNRMFLYLRL